MISIIIPTLNEERALPATLEAALRQPGEPEIFVVDGGSEDRTERIVREVTEGHPRVRWLQAPRGRARQMNAGAAKASGDWLLFLHADTVLPEAATAQIASLASAVRAGCFRQRFSGASRLLRLLSWLHNRRFRVTRVIYGDQAPFVRRDLFEELAGFPDRLMEDVAFSLALRSATVPVMLPATVLTDSRKFDQMGHWTALRHAIGLLLRFRLGIDVTDNEFFRDYR